MSDTYRYLTTRVYKNHIKGFRMIIPEDEILIYHNLLESTPDHWDRGMIVYFEQFNPDWHSIKPHEYSHFISRHQRKIIPEKTKSIGYFVLMGIKK